MVSQMSPRERLLTTIKHEEPDRVPVAPRIWAWFLEYYGDSSWRTYLRAKEEFDFDPIIFINSGVNDYISQWAGIITDNCVQLEDVSLEQEVVQEGDYKVVRKKFTTPAGTLTDEKRIPPRGGAYGIAPNPEVKEPLLKSIEDLQKVRFLLPYPDKADYSHIRKITEAVGEKGLVVVRPTVGSDAFTVDAMGIENAMIAYKLDRQFLEDTLQIFHQYNLKVAKKCLETGAEVIFDSGFNMSLSAGWSPQAWKNLFYPRVKEMCDLAHSYGAYYHYYDDGKLMDILYYLAEIGVDVVATCTPPPVGDFDLKEAKKIFGTKLCFKGPIDLLYVIKMGTPETIRETVAEAIKIGAPGGGFILSTSDSIRDETPLENVKAYFQAGREFGKYPIS